jgi:hypothetical protein
MPALGARHTAAGIAQLVVTAARWSQHPPRKPRGIDMTLRYTTLALAAAALLLGACATKEEAAPANVLVAAKVATPPVLDGNP